MTANLELLKPSIFFIQETKFMKKGLFKAKDYEIFENIRPSGGGSILTGVHQNLSPILIDVIWRKLKLLWLKVQYKRETVGSLMHMDPRNRQIKIREFNFIQD